jgi:hypothetical protein
MANEVKSGSKKEELLKLLESLRIPAEHRNKIVQVAFRPPKGVVYPAGYTRYELILYKDVKQEDGSWKTTVVRVVPKTNNFSEITKVIPNAKALIEKAEAEAEEE